MWPSHARLCTAKSIGAGTSSCNMGSIRRKSTRKIWTPEILLISELLDNTENAFASGGIWHTVALA